MNPQQTAKYRAQSRVFLSQAFEELERGDLPQASEKGWGAAAQMVKAIASERGWRHNSHLRLRRIVGRLSTETGDLTLNDLFDDASFLHRNFYENDRSLEVIQGRLRRVGRFVERVEGLLGERA